MKKYIQLLCFSLLSSMPALAQKSIYISLDYDQRKFSEELAGKIDDIFKSHTEIFAFRYRKTWNELLNQGEEKKNKTLLVHGKVKADHIEFRVEHLETKEVHAYHTGWARKNELHLLEEVAETAKRIVHFHRFGKPILEVSVSDSITIECKGLDRYYLEKFFEYLPKFLNDSSEFAPHFVFVSNKGAAMKLDSRAIIHNDITMITSFLELSMGIYDAEIEFNRREWNKKCAKQLVNTLWLKYSPQPPQAPEED